MAGSLADGNRGVLALVANAKRKPLGEGLCIPPDAVAREAFRFANQAMALQRVRSELSRARLADPTRSFDGMLAELDVPAQAELASLPASVRLVLPARAHSDPSHPDAHRGAGDCEVELPFFLTGGAKTDSSQER